MPISWRTFTHCFCIGGSAAPSTTGSAVHDTGHAGAGTPAPRGSVAIGATVGRTRSPTPSASGRSSPARDVDDDLRQLGIAAPWLRLDAIGEQCAIDSEAHDPFLTRLADLRREISGHDVASGEVGRARARALALVDRATRLVEAHERLEFAERYLDPVELGRTFITMPGETSEIRQALDHLGEKLAASDSAHSDPSIAEAHRQARDTSRRLLQRAHDALAAHHVLGLQAAWLVPPDIDRLCWTRAHIASTRADLQAMSTALDAKMDEARSAGGVSEALERAFTVCRTVLADAGGIAAARHDLLERFPGLEPSAEDVSTVADQAWIGSESQTDLEMLDAFYLKGRLIAKVAHGRAEGELKDTDVPNFMTSVIEIVAAAHKSPRQVDLHAETAINFLCNLRNAGWATGFGSTAVELASAWPDKLVDAKAARAKVDAFTKIGPTVNYQPTWPLCFIEHFGILIERSQSEKFVSLAHRDEREIAAAFERAEGAPLSRAALQFLVGIANVIRNCQESRGKDHPTLHNYLKTMSRKRYNSLFAHALRTEEDRRDVRRVLDPAQGQGTALLLQAMGIEKGRLLLNRGYKETGLVAIEAPPHARSRVDTFDGPSIEEFLVSIVDPDSPADALSAIVDLIGLGVRDFGIGGHGDVDPASAEAFFELRNFRDLPRDIPVTALRTLAMLHYLYGSRLSPRLPQVDVPARSRRELARAHGQFKSLAALFVESRAFAHADMSFEAREEACATLARLATAGSSVEQLIRDHPGARGEADRLALLVAFGSVAKCASDDLFAGVKYQAAALATELFDTIPQMLEQLYQPEHEAWDKWLAAHSPAPSTAPSLDEDTLLDIRTPRTFGSRRPPPPPPPGESAARSHWSAPTLQAVLDQSFLAGPAGVRDRIASILRDVSIDDAPGLIAICESVNVPAPGLQDGTFDLLHKIVSIPGRAWAAIATRLDPTDGSRQFGAADFERRVDAFGLLRDWCRHPGLDGTARDRLAAILSLFPWRIDTLSLELGGSAGREPLVGRFVACPLAEWPRIADGLAALRLDDFEMADMTAVAHWLLDLSPEQRARLPLPSRAEAAEPEPMQTSILRCAFRPMPATGSVEAWHALIDATASDPALAEARDRLPRELLSRARPAPDAGSA